MDDKWLTFKLGTVYERPDGKFCITWTWDFDTTHESIGSCCNNGHETPSDARQHGDDKVKVLRSHRWVEIL